MDIQEKTNHKKYSKEDRAEHIKKWQSSGIRKAVYSKENNIPPTTFYTWSRKLKSQTRRPSFVEIKFDNKQLREEHTIELVIGNGISLKMREGISPGILRGLISGLKGI